MTRKIPLHTLTLRKFFLVIMMFVITGCLFSIMAESLNALDIDNSNHQPNYFQEIPLNNTDKSKMIILLSNLVHDKILTIVNALEISSKDESLKNVPFLENVSSDFKGIHSTLDLNKRNLAKDILQRNKDIASIFFVLPNGNIYMGEPFSDQEQLPRINFADREWYKGVAKSNQTYVSSIFLSASINAPAIAIAVPVHSFANYLTSHNGSTFLSGYWVGIINLKSLEDLFESLSLGKDQFILIDHNGTVLLDSKKLKTEMANSSNLANKSSSLTDSDVNYPDKLETFDHFNLIKASGNDSSSVYGNLNLDDQSLMFWKSIKIKDSNWYIVLITRI